MNSTKVTELAQHGKKIVVHSGNITNWIPKHNQSATDTIASVVEAAIKNWLGREYSSEEWREPGSVLIRNAALFKAVSSEELNDQQFTVKIFLNESNVESFRAAVETTVHELGLRSIHLMIISLTPSGEELTLDKLTPLWRAMEELVHNRTVFSLGVAGLDHLKLQELYDWSSVKPKVSQVDLADCCTMPEELVKYAREKDIQLQASTDEPNTLLGDALHGVVGNAFGTDCSSWKHTWISKYTSLIHLRSIVAHKGYLLELQRT